MHHGFAGRRFGRSSSHRQAMLANLAVSLIEHEQIVTTLPKAKDLRPIVEKLVTLGKRGDLHARRNLIAQIGNEGVVRRLFDTIAPRYATRNGGYLRIREAALLGLAQLESGSDLLEQHRLVCPAKRSRSSIIHCHEAPA